MASRLLKGRVHKRPPSSAPYSRMKKINTCLKSKHYSLRKGAVVCMNWVVLVSSTQLTQTLGEPDSLATWCGCGHSGSKPYC